MIKHARTRRATASIQQKTGRPITSGQIKRKVTFTLLFRPVSAPKTSAVGDQPALSNFGGPVKNGTASRFGRILRTFGFVFLASQRKQLKLSGAP